MKAQYMKIPGFGADYFMRRLLTYLLENRYVIDPDTTTVIQNVEDAENAFSEARLAGRSVDEAMESADDSLFRNVGLSQYDIVAGIMEDLYSESGEPDSAELEYRTIRALTEIPDLFDGMDSDGLGIDPLEFDLHRDLLTGRINDFIQDYGVQ